MGGENNPPPWQYIQLILCRDVYHCTPNELDEIDLLTMNIHLRLMGVEKQVQAFKNSKSNTTANTMGLRGG